MTAGAVDPPAQGTTLDRRTLGRALLARQRLLERADVPVPEMVEHLVGLQAQVPRDPYISLWSRLERFDPETLERLLLERAAVRMTLMRATLHLATAADAQPLRAAMQDVCERTFAASPFRRRLEGLDLAALLEAGRGLLEDRPRTIAELGTALAGRWPDRDRQAMAYAVRYLVPLVQVTPRGLLRRSEAPRLATLDAWLGAPRGPRPEPGLALDATVRRYLRAFGPATVSDIRAWSGRADLRGVVDRLRPSLRIYRDEAGRELLDVADGIFASGDAPAPVRLLGEYDNVFLGHADRSRVTGDLSWGMAYARRGAFFVDGTLAGAWRSSEANGRGVLALDAHRTLRRGDRAAVRDEAMSFARFLWPDGASPAVRWEA
jgi:DNA glycosylase AlkZ-like